MSREKKCNCEQISCQEDCVQNHTHKHFWCEICHPERYSSAPQDKKKCTCGYEEGHGLTCSLYKCKPFPTPHTNWEEEVEEVLKRYIPSAKGRLMMKGYIRSLLLSERTRLKEEIKKLELKHDYDGNDLKSAADKYYISAENWSEIIRYEDGYGSALSAVLKLLE